MFNKRGEVVDFTLLQKLKKKHSKSSLGQAATEAPSVPSVGGFLDFTSVAPQSSNTGTQDTQSSTFGFLSDFASSAQTAQDVTSKLGNPDAEVNALRLKIEDVEFKLDRLLERLSEIETRFRG